jgi:hypothetical protein
MLTSCQLNTVKSDYGVKSGNYLTIIVPLINNPQPGSTFIPDNSCMIDSILFKGDQHKQPFDYSVGFMVYHSGYTIEGKKYICLSNSIILQRQYNAKSDFRLFLDYKNNKASNYIQYILEYDHIKDTIHSELGVISPGSYYTNASQIYTDFIKDIYLVASFEFISKYNTDSIYGNFQRLLKFQNKQSTDPSTGKIIKSYFTIEGESRADIYPSIYPYQNGSKTVVTAIIYSKEYNHTIDFLNDYESIISQLQAVVND